MKILFICNQNKHRSKTAEEIFKYSFDVKSAGLYTEHPVTQEQISWADLVVVMEDDQRKEISTRFPKLYLKKRIISLGISDIYRYKDPELIQILKEKMHDYLTEKLIL